jgi:hypothetical protein
MSTPRLLRATPAESEPFAAGTPQTGRIFNFTGELWYEGQLRSGAAWGRGIQYRSAWWAGHLVQVIFFLWGGGG